MDKSYYHMMENYIAGCSKKLGYVSPQKFLWDYCKNKKIIERTKRGEYKLLID